MRLSKNDLTIRTALLEGRYVWGDQELFEEGSRRFTAEVVQGNQRNFVTEKLAERNARRQTEDPPLQFSWIHNRAV